MNSQTVSHLRSTLASRQKESADIITRLKKRGPAHRAAPSCLKGSGLPDK